MKRVDTVKLARELRTALDNPPAGGIWGFGLARADAMRLFGNGRAVRRYFRDSILEAATIEPRRIPAGRCRWDYALVAAVRMNVADPGSEKLPSDLELLGAPCAHCLQRWRADSQRRVAASRAAVRRVAAAGRGRSPRPSSPRRPLDTKALAAGLQRYGSMPCAQCSRSDDLVWHERSVCPRLRVGSRR